MRQSPIIVPVRGPFCETWTAGPGLRSGLRTTVAPVPGRYADADSGIGRRTPTASVSSDSTRGRDTDFCRLPVRDCVSDSVLDAVCNGVCDNAHDDTRHDIHDDTRHDIHDDGRDTAVEDLPGFWRRTDPGSGTVLGVALIAVTALLMAALAMAGNVVLCRAQARTAADLAAIAAATAWADRSDDIAACSIAADAVTANGASLASCVIDGEDAQVVAGVTTQVPIAPQVTYESRAGPVDCGP
ncbi:Rv3654c family TadE-like protein [Bifidobacterium samirii]|nr:Rv3654c family TadE-like protein [Bifidobacterium samirii]